MSDDDATAVEWRYNPWRERPGRAVSALGALLLCFGLTMTSGLPALVTVSLCLGCLAMLSSAVLPIACRLDPQGVTRRSVGIAERRPWTALQRAVRTPEGVLLSPFDRRHWLEPHRALFLPLPSRQRLLGDDVERVLTAHGL